MSQVAEHLSLAEATAALEVLAELRLRLEHCDDSEHISLASAYAAEVEAMVVELEQRRRELRKEQGFATQEYDWEELSKHQH